MRDARFVDKLYYIRFGSLFYEPLEQWYSPDTHLLQVVKDRLLAHQAKNHWKVRRRGLWFYAEPKNAALPPQGWKIHVSSRLDRIEEVLAVVADVLIPRFVPFKFALDKTIYALFLDKRWERGASG
ncbi:MAG: hypothetical protein ACP5LJ_04510 [Candidatus Bipolaricaulaceae bacterium]